MSPGPTCNPTGSPSSPRDPAHIPFRLGDARSTPGDSEIGFLRLLGEGDFAAKPSCSGPVDTATSRRFEQRGARLGRHLSPSIFCKSTGQDRRNLALEVRRAELEALVAGIDAITFTETIDAEGAIVFAKAVRNGSSRSASAGPIGAGVPPEGRRVDLWPRCRCTVCGTSIGQTGFQALFSLIGVYLYRSVEMEENHAYSSCQHHRGDCRSRRNGHGGARASLHPVVALAGSARYGRRNRKGLVGPVVKKQFGYDLGVPVNWSAYEDIAEYFTNTVKTIDGQRIYGHMDYGKK